MDEMSATLMREYTHPKDSGHLPGQRAGLPNGNVIVGWGSAPFFSEYSKDGEPLIDASFPGSTQSYRAFRFHGPGTPLTTRPWRSREDPTTK